MVAALVPLVPFAVIGELPGETWLQSSTGSAGTFAVTGAAILACDLLLPIPSSVVGSLLGARLGFAWGAAAAFVGLCLGNVIGYGIGRLFPARFRDDIPRAPAASIIFITRPVPVLAEAVALAAGVERVGFARFVAASALGNACYALALAGNGAALLPSGLAGPGLIVPMTVPVLTWGLWRLLRRRCAHHGSTR